VQHVHDCQADIQTNEVGQRERAHRMIHPDFHDSVDRFASADAFHDGVDRLVDHRHQDPIRDEPWKILGLHRRLSQPRA